MKQEEEGLNEVIKPLPNQCHFYLPQKHRFCKNKQALNGQYCCTHVPCGINGETKDISEKKRRIPCPVDPSHTIYARNCKKHAKICNKTHALNLMKSQPYYCENINSIAFSDDEKAYFASDNSSIDNMTDSSNGIETDASNNYQETPLNNWLTSVEHAYFISLVQKIRKLHAKLQIDQLIKMNTKQPELCEPFLAQEDELQSDTKHIKQQCSIIGHLMERNCFSEDVNYVEFGCGRAELSYMVRQSILLKRKSTFEKEPYSIQEYVLIDRANQRKKSDNNIRYGTSYNEFRIGKKLNNEKDTRQPVDSSVLVHRVLIDISHLHFGKLQMMNNTRSCVCVSKHLCGVATDLTLRCLTQTNQISGQLCHPIKGIFIALCCHHKCAWHSYVTLLSDQRFFESEGFSREEFEQMKLLTSWAVCHFRNRIVDANSTFGLEINEKVELGFMCKRIIDYGRLQYLVQQGYNAELIYYCNRITTPENCLLVASLK